VAVLTVAPCRAVTAYDKTGVPPLAAEAFQESVAFPAPGSATALRSVGGTGFVQSSRRDFAGEFINALKSPSEHFFIDSFLDDCAFSSGLLVMIDATDSLQLDKEYSQAFSTLRRELTSRIRRGGWKVKYKIAVVFSKADQYKIWKYRKRLKEFISINFPCTQRVFQEWSKDGYCVVSYFACSAFGMRGNPPQPNVIDDVSNGNCGYLADPTVWQPFGLASAIYWLSTGKVDARLQ
jgi:hypothetical protein